MGRMLVEAYTDMVIVTGQWFNLSCLLARQTTLNNR